MIILIAILQIGGGFLAMLNVVSVLAGAEGIAAFLSLVFLGLYGFGIAAGVMLLNGTDRGVRWSTVFQGLQIPHLLSPIFTYKFASGFHFTFYTGSEGFSFNFATGFHWLVGLFESINHWQVGVNTVAVYLFVYLLRHLRQRSEDEYSRRQMPQHISAQERS